MVIRTPCPTKECVGLLWQIQRICIIAFSPHVRNTRVSGFWSNVDLLRKQEGLGLEQDLLKQDGLGLDENDEGSYELPSQFS